MHLHRWVEIEWIGNIVTLQCAKCLKRRTRVRGALLAAPTDSAEG